MTSNEANKILEKFMGGPPSFFRADSEFEKPNHKVKYTDSIDSLIPVWTKLGVVHWRVELEYGKYVEIVIDRRRYNCHFNPEKEGYAYAAAIATAKAVLEAE
jgi:hypothetical protein